MSYVDFLVRYCLRHLIHRSLKIFELETRELIKTSVKWISNFISSRSDTGQGWLNYKTVKIFKNFCQPIKSAMFLQQLVLTSTSMRGTLTKLASRKKRRPWKRWQNRWILFDRHTRSIQWFR